MAKNKLEDLNTEQISQDFESTIDTENHDTETSSTSADPNTEMELLKNEVKFIKLELEDWKNRAARLTADLQNLSRQQELELQQAKKSAKKATLMSIISFLNTLNLAFSFAPLSEDEKVNKFISTLKTSFERLVDDLRGIGVEIVLPSVGDPFNPEFMNILNPDQLTDTEASEVLVKQVVSCGVKIDNQLLQPANIMI